jgi:hypothetical protein
MNKRHNQLVRNSKRNKQKRGKRELEDEETEVRHVKGKRIPSGLGGGLTALPV